MLTLLIVSFSLREECDGHFDVIFERERVKWFLDRCRRSENGLVRYYMAVNHLLVNHFWTWMRLKNFGVTFGTKAMTK